MELSDLQKNLNKLVDSFSDQDETKVLEKLVTELKMFMQYIEKVDKSAVDKVLSDLESKSDNALFNEVGRLLRRFHDQLVLIREGIPEDLGKIASQEVVEMSEKLQMIVSMTDKAANTTMDLTEEIIDSLNQQNENCNSIKMELNGLIEKNNFTPEILKILKNSINQVQGLAKNNDSLQEKLTNILIAQDYQDLTGQVIFKVINLLKSLEKDLAQLINRFGQILKETDVEEETQLKGPLSEVSQEKSSQDDVDSLLTKFGF